MVSTQLSKTNTIKSLFFPALIFVLMLMPKSVLGKTIQTETPPQESLGEIHVAGGTFYVADNSVIADKITYHTEEVTPKKALPKTNQPVLKKNTPPLAVKKQVYKKPKADIYINPADESNTHFAHAVQNSKSFCSSNRDLTKLIAVQSGTEGSTLQKKFSYKKQHKLYVYFLPKVNNARYYSRPPPHVFLAKKIYLQTIYNI